MTKRANLFFLLIALVLALLTTLVVVKQLTRWKTAHAQKTASVVVVVKGVPAHQIVSADAVAIKKVPVDAIESGDMTSLQQVVGHYTSSAWFPGQQVLSAMVLSNEQKAAFPLTIPQGYRAFTVANDPVSGVDHLISKGDRVDVLVTYSDSKEKGPIVSTLLQNVLVLYADNAPTISQTGTAVASSQSGNSSNAQSPSSADTLTLAVTPTQAEALQFATSFGRIHIDLRDPSDASAAAPVSPVAPVGPGSASLSSP